MKVLIIGSRGIPNRYGGFEELAERLAVHLVNKKHEVTVCNPKQHPYTSNTFEGVTLVRAFDPAFLGSFGQFIYDLNCILKSRSIQPDIVLQLGYTSSAIWYWLIPSKSRVLTNMDGMEWKRSKYNRLTRLFLRFSEKISATQSHLLVADHKAIQNYFQQRYTNQMVYIPYGADIPTKYDASALDAYNVKPFRYQLVIARMEPENHIEEIIKGVLGAKSNTPLLVMGNLETRYGQRLVARYSSEKIIFTPANYQKETLNALRHYATLYFHGHSVGGTNPSLLEAMACSARIVAHDNPYNRGVLGKHAHYFQTPEAISTFCDADVDEEAQKKWVRQNLSKVRTRYSWRTISDQYEISMQQLLLR